MILYIHIYLLTIKATLCFVCIVFKTPDRPDSVGLSDF